MPSLITLLQKHFPDVSLAEADETLHVGSFPEWDSLAHFNFLLRIEQEYGVRFTMEELSEMKSLAEIGRALIGHGADVS